MEDKTEESLPVKERLLSHDWAASFWSTLVPILVTTMSGLVAIAAIPEVRSISGLHNLTTENVSSSPIEIASEIKLSLDRVEDLVAAVEELAESARKKDEELAKANRELEVLRDMNGWSEETRQEFYRLMNPPIWQDWLFRFIQVLLGAIVGLVAKIWWDKREAKRAVKAVKLQ